MTQYYLGAHTIDNGGIDMAVRRAAAAGMTAMQLFTAPPRFYGDRSGIRPERVERFRAALAETSMDPKRIIVHGAYVLGVATPEEDKWERAAAGLAKEMERSTTLGVGGVCFHPGSAAKSPVEEATARVGLAITRALQGVKGETRLLVENTAGAGKTVGRTAAEVADILSHVPANLRPRTGYGLDTCHLFSSGYELRGSPDAITRVLDEWEEATGEPPAFLHLNDSEGELGSNRDRHTLLGDGQIGLEPFRWLLADRRARGIPLILETPQKHPDVADDDPTPDPWDVKMMRLLREMTAKV